MTHDVQEIAIAGNEFTVFCVRDIQTGHFVATFDGPDRKQQANQYAKWLNSTPQPDIAAVEPAAEPPKATYASGEVPMVGDVVFVGKRKEEREATAFENHMVTLDGIDEWEIRQCTLIRRASPEPTQEKSYWHIAYEAACPDNGYNKLLCQLSRAERAIPERVAYAVASAVRQREVEPLRAELEKWRKNFQDACVTIAKPNSPAPEAP